MRRLVTALLLVIVGCGPAKSPTTNEAARDEKLFAVVAVDDAVDALVKALNGGT